MYDAIVGQARVDKLEQMTKSVKNTKVHSLLIKETLNLLQSLGSKCANQLKRSGKPSTMEN